MVVHIVIVQQRYGVHIGWVRLAPASERARRRGRVLMPAFRGRHTWGHRWFFVRSRLAQGCEEMGWAGHLDRDDHGNHFGPRGRNQSK